MNLECYDDFVRDYNNPNITSEDVKRYNQLNSHRYLEIRNIALNRGDIPPVRRMNRENAKFYTVNENGEYIVKKQFGHTCIFVGKFSNQTTAETVVQKCKDVNWNINEIRDFIDEHKIKPKNYSLVNNAYTVQKSIDGQNIVFCRVADEDTAKKVVSELRNCNWDKTQVPHILERMK